jgi:hypothetical protein
MRALAVSLVLLLGGLYSAACRPASHDREASDPVAFPAVGLAVRDSADAWCAAFPSDASQHAQTTGRALAVGEPVTLVFAGAAAVPSLRATISARRSEPCPAAFPQPRWDTYTAYDIVLDGSLRYVAADAPVVALAVASDKAWVRDPDGYVRADLDGDGVPEEARQCAADEGQHFTVWSRAAPYGEWQRRAHEYYDWGVLVEPTCRLGDDGRDSTATAGPRHPPGRVDLLPWDS